MASMNTQHPLQFSKLKNHAIPFGEIQIDHYLPALKTAIEQAKEAIKKIETDASPATFKNTIMALEMAGEDVDLISTVFYNLLSANTNDKMQALAGEIGPLLAGYSSDIQLSAPLFQRIKFVYDNEKKNLKIEDSELLEKYYSNFTRNGALLSDKDKETLRTYDAEMSKLGPQFSDNVLKATNDFLMVITNADEVKGIPPSSLEAARIVAEEKGHKGAWAFTLQAPSYIAFMTYAEHRPSREKMYRAYATRAFKDKFDNQKVLLRTVELREKRARLLGYKNHAEFVLEKRMAESPEKVFTFLEKIKSAAVKAAKKDIEQVTQFAHTHGGPSEIMPWDFGFWSEKLKEHLFQFKAEDLRPYFQLEKVVAGVFKHAELLYGLEFKEAQDYPVYHPDVKAYEVYQKESGAFIGLFYTDFFPRESKNGGAWMTNYYEQGYFHNEVHRPHVAIVCNFTKPTPNKPSLLTFDEVNTLFHEFGHALHSLLSQCTYRSLAGTNVYWDFVELPSQIMENWVVEKESLDLFAEHYETHEKIPLELTKKIKDSSRFQAGYMTLRQVTFAWLDMMWHTTEFGQIQDPSQFEEKHVAPLRVLPYVAGTNFSCAFTHVFAGGYSAGYYSYKWAEVLDADAFELFKEKGLFDKETAQTFRQNILSRGGTEHPMELYKKFRGREPHPDALLKRDGLI